MNDKSALLTGLSFGELEALAESMLAHSSQHGLDDLLRRKGERTLPAAEEAELDGLLEKVDQLTLLKTRARYTLARTTAASEVL